MGGGASRRRRSHFGGAPAAAVKLLTEFPEAAPSSRALPWLSRAVAVATLVMISLGALVTSRDAGLSIPDGVSNHGTVLPAEQLRSGYVTPEGRVYKGEEV
jgi:heme A synthase